MLAHTLKSCLCRRFRHPYLWPLALSAFLTIVTLPGCSLRLKEPPAAPSISPVGLWISRPEPNRVEILRVVCGLEQCWFRNTLVYRRDLALSGRVLNVTERNGYFLTSATELLQIQTEYRSEQFKVPEKIQAQKPTRATSVLDRVVRGESTFRMLRFEGKDSLVGGDAAFTRHCPESGCHVPMALVLDGSKEGEPALIISPDLPWMLSSDAKLPDGLRPVIEAGVILYAMTDRPGGTILQVGGKKSPDLPLIYESHISLSPGTAAIMLTRTRTEDGMNAKKKRSLEIRERLKRGETVSREEMIEALEGGP